MSDYAELIKRVRDCAETNSLSLYKRVLMKQAADAIEELADRNVGKWIPVTERLPSKNGFYLCLYKHKHPGGVAIDEGLSIQQWYNGRWNLDEIYTVTHWMPLPEPPKEES